MALDSLILGINVYHADAAACIVRDGVLVAAAERNGFGALNIGRAFHLGDRLRKPKLIWPTSRMSRLGRLAMPRWRRHSPRSVFNGCAVADTPQGLADVPAEFTLP